MLNAGDPVVPTVREIAAAVLEHDAEEILVDEMPEGGLGDVVEVTNSGGPILPIYDTYGDWELSWADWQAGSALHGR